MSMGAQDTNRNAPVALAVVGPTASGKTALSLPLAERYAGEILCCDSMQIYRGMDIGTAKATKGERLRVPHHCLDLLSPLEEYSAADYGAYALSVAEDVTARGKLPIFVGGTGLYLEAARSGRHGAPIETDPAFRQEMECLAEKEGALRVHALLAQVDSEAAEEIHPNNLRRVIRALEIFRQTGKKKSELDRESKTLPPKIRLCPLFLNYRDRELLYRRIEERVWAMVEAGLFEEVAALWEAGLLKQGSTASQAIGYKEVLAALRGECTREAAVAEIILATRRYAKRQITWFSAVADARVIYMDDETGMRSITAVLEETFALCDEFLQENVNKC